MSNNRIQRVSDVSEWRLCMGCGACTYACPNAAVSLSNILDKGIRPAIDENKCKHCTRCLSVCPGIKLSQDQPLTPDMIKELYREWGPVLQMWEGSAQDQEIRFKGSSGGAATAIALYCLEQQNAAGIVHTSVKDDDPITNHTVISRTRDQLISRTGSRYAPAAVCEEFKEIADSYGNYVFIGKPCDIAALSKARKLDLQLDSKILLTISIFCAGTPNTLGTHNVLKAMGINDISKVRSFRYRGHGWPGQAVAELNDSEKTRSMCYSKMWGQILSKHGQLRCRLCADSTGEFADISCGDPWYINNNENELGYSLVVARTKIGEDFIRKCMSANYLHLRTAPPSHMIKSQISLHERRCQLWGRLLAFRFFRIPHPHFQRMHLFKSWWSTTLTAKLRSILATTKRIITRKLYHPEYTTKKNSSVERKRHAKKNTTPNRNHQTKQ